MTVYIHNPVISQFGKLDETVLSLSVKTAKKALEGFDREQIDFLVFSSFAPEVYTQEYHIPPKLLSALQMKDVFAIRSETASSSGASAFQLAVNLIQSGRYKTGLVVATEVMSKLGREESNLLLGSVLSPRQIQLCMFMAQGGAMITNRYLYEYNYPKEDLFYIAEKLHNNGFNNPYAHIKKKISFTDYQKAPLFYSPLGLYDISPLSDGSAALILSGTIPSDVSVKGMGHGTNNFWNESLEVSFPASVSAFQKAYAEARVSPQDIQAAELHDAFTMFEVIGAEDAGLVPRGKGLEFVKNKLTHPDGQIPINASGGLKTRGHPIAASGLAQIVELSQFLKTKNLSLGLTHSIGGLATNNFATIIERK
jgi:acetyl-CoA acetyltransferase